MVVGKPSDFPSVSPLEATKRGELALKKKIWGWALGTAVAAHGILGERMYQNQYRVDLKERGEGSSDKIRPTL